MGSPWLALFSGCYPGRPGLHPRANVGPGDAPRSGGRSEPRPRERERERDRERERERETDRNKDVERQRLRKTDRKRKSLDLDHRGMV